MQWDDTPNAGFTTPSATPWMRLNDNFTHVNAAAQVDDPESVFRCYRAVLDARKSLKDVFVYGDFGLVDEAHDQVFAYKRTAEDGEEAALVVCNFTDVHVQWKMPLGAREVLVSPAGRTVEELGKGKIVRLAPCEAFAVLLL